MGEKIIIYSKNLKKIKLFLIIKSIMCDNQNLEYISLFNHYKNEMKSWKGGKLPKNIYRMTCYKCCKNNLHGRIVEFGESTWICLECKSIRSD